MNRYESSIPRIAFGAAAIAMSAITLGLSVVLPANLAFKGYESQALAAAKSHAPTAIEVAIVPARIDVGGQCDENMAYEAAKHTESSNDQRS